MMDCTGFVWPGFGSSATAALASVGADETSPISSTVNFRQLQDGPIAAQGWAYQGWRDDAFRRGKMLLCNIDCSWREGWEHARAKSCRHPGQGRRWGRKCSRSWGSPAGHGGHGCCSASPSACSDSPQLALAQRSARDTLVFLGRSGEWLRLSPFRQDSSTT